MSGSGQEFGGELIPQNRTRGDSSAEQLITGSHLFVCWEVVYLWRLRLGVPRVRSFVVECGV